MASSPRKSTTSADCSSSTPPLFLPEIRGGLPRAAEISGRLRRERELAFYGDLDFIPTEQYTTADAQRAYDEAAWVVTLAAGAIDALKA